MQLAVGTFQNVSGNGCERIAHRVGEAHWHDAESLHVAVLGDEVVDESLLDLDNGSED